MTKNAVCVWFWADDATGCTDKSQGHGNHGANCKQCPASALTADGRLRRAGWMDARARAVWPWTFGTRAAGILWATAFPTLDFCFFAGFSVYHDFARPKWCAIRETLAITASAWTARAGLAKGCLPAAPEWEIRALVG